MDIANNTITAPKGFLAAGLHCGVKKSGKPDLALLACPSGARAAAVFTTNKMASAPVILSRRHVRSRSIHAVIVNSGNANACTGPAGMDNAEMMCAETAGRMGIGLSPENILVASTGIIGEQLPMAAILGGIARAAARLSPTPGAGRAFARAIMTTDTKVKQAVRRVTFKGGTGGAVTIAGTTKGAGMIAPNMATTLSFFTTDAAIGKPLLSRALKAAVGSTLNKLTVDGHQSTNDTAIILASGQAGNRPITGACPRYRKFTAALFDLCYDLLRQMALDAEGVTRFFKVRVGGAATRADAAKACRAIADYALVKCAVHGGDPNWGRIVCAAGSSGAALDPGNVTCKLDNLVVFKNGAGVKFDASRAVKIVSKTLHTIDVDLGAGKHADFCYGCDLSAEYVKINAHYHT
jgi:glutamate N-acetyltransferase/amino-acid N-acetyltransferase